MAVGEYPFPNMHPVRGVKLTAVCAGIKKVDRRDVVLFELAEDLNELFPHIYGPLNIDSVVSVTEI